MGILKFLGRTLLAAVMPTTKTEPTLRTPQTSTRSNELPAAPLNNADILDGMIFCATMQPRIPLRVLSRHGEVFRSDHGDLPAIAKAAHEGIWLPHLRGQGAFQGSMASTVGPIPTDGGTFLPFLIAIRKIVEASASVENRIRTLSAELSRPQWADFVEKLEPMPGDLVRQFFPRAVDTIPGLPQAASDRLEAAGLNTANKIAAAADADILAIKGVGKAKLASIRDWQEADIDRNATRLDFVDR